MPATPNFSSIKALSFDIYGTLIDWEEGILPTLHPLTSQLPSTHPCHPSSPTYHASTIAAFSTHEVRAIAANPAVVYDDLLARSYNDLAKEWNLVPTKDDAAYVASSISGWKAFPDTVVAIQALGKRFKLIALSNISHSAFAKTANGPLKNVDFDAAYLAEEIGSYKPDKKNFEFLLEGAKREFGVVKEELLHVAHGVTSDQLPAEEMGIAHAWIERNEDNWNGIEKTVGLKSWGTLGDMAASVEEEMGGSQKH